MRMLLLRVDNWLSESTFSMFGFNCSCAIFCRAYGLGLKVSVS